MDGRSDCGPLELLRLPNILHRRLLPSPPFSAAVALFWMFAMSISFSNSSDVLSARCALALSSRAPAGRWRSSQLLWLLGHATASGLFWPPCYTSSRHGSEHCSHAASHAQRTSGAILMFGQPMHGMSESDRDPPAPADVRLASAPASSAAASSWRFTSIPRRSRLLSISSSRPWILLRRSCSVATSASAATYQQAHTRLTCTDHRAAYGHLHNCPWCRDPYIPLLTECQRQPT